MLLLKVKRLFFFYTFIKINYFDVFGESIFLKVIKNSKIKVNNDTLEKKKIDEVKVKKKGCCCKNKNEEKKKIDDQSEATEKIKRTSSKIIENIFKTLGTNYEIIEKTNFFDENLVDDKINNNSLQKDIYELVKTINKNNDESKDDKDDEKPEITIDFKNSGFYLKYLSEFITVSMETISKLFLDEVKNYLLKCNKGCTNDILLSFTDFKNVMKSFKDKYFKIEQIDSLLKEILNKLQNNNPLRRVFLGNKENSDLFLDILNLVGEIDIFKNMKDFDIDKIKFENIFIILLKNVLKNSDKYFYSLSKSDDTKFNEFIERFSKYLEFNVEINLNNYRDFIDKKNDSNGFSIEDYVLIFKFIDFCNGNLDLFNSSNKLYNFKVVTREIKDNNLLNLAGIEVINKLKQENIINKRCYNEVKETTTEDYEIKDKDKFRQEFKIKFSDLKYVFKLIKSVDIYMYFDSTNKNDIYDRYNKYHIIYDVYNKNYNIINSIKFFKEKLNEQNINNEYLVLDKIKKSISYLYCKSETGDSKEVRDANGNVIENIWSIVVKGKKLDYNKLCSSIKKLSIILNKDYFGIFCDQITSLEN